MMTAVDPALAERLATTNAETRDRSVEIGDRVRATAQEIADESERMREAAAWRSAELDRQVEERKEAENNQWARSPQRDTTMRFGEEEEELERAATPPPVRPAAPEPPPAEPRRGRHARNVDDEDDFSSTSWLV